MARNIIDYSKIDSLIKDVVHKKNLEVPFGQYTFEDNKFKVEVNFGEKFEILASGEGYEYLDEIDLSNYLKFFEALVNGEILFDLRPKNSIEQFLEKVGFKFYSRMYIGGIDDIKNIQARDKVHTFLPDRNSIKSIVI